MGRWVFEETACPFGFEHTSHRATWRFVTGGHDEFRSGDSPRGGSVFPRRLKPFARARGRSQR